MMPYDPSKWYWTVAGSTTQVWSSAAAAYVLTSDEGYTAWLATGNLPTTISNEADLFFVLNAIYPAGTGTLGTAQQRATAMLAGGTVAVTSTATPALNGTYAVDAMATANITAIQVAISAGVGLPGGGTTLAYVDVAGADHNFTAPQFTAFAATIANYVYALTRCAYGKSNTLPSAALTIP